MPKQAKKRQKRTTKKTTKRAKRKVTSLALTIPDMQLTAQQRSVIATRTPQQFVKQRKGKRGQTFTYVEVGYIISQLNSAFSLSWDFEILREEVMMYDKPRGKEGKELGEVWLKGQLTVKDFKSGYKVNKTQFGGHTVYLGVLVSDSLKAAASDSLKKCASLFGFALDVFWQSMESEGEVTPSKPVTPDIPEDVLVKNTIELIKNTTSIDLLLQMAKKIDTKEAQIKEAKNREEIKKWISARLEKLQN